MYGVFPYFVAKILAELPSFIIPPAWFTLITFFGIGFTKDVENYFTFWAALTMSVLAGISFGYMVSSSFSNPSIAMQLAPVIVMPLMLVGGFFRNQDDMPMWMQVFSYAAPFKYVFNILARSEYGTSEHENAERFL